MDSKSTSTEFWHINSDISHSRTRISSSFSIATSHSTRISTTTHQPAVGNYAIEKKVKGSPYSITERRVPELIPVIGSQPAGDVSHKPGGRLSLLSARPAVTLATLKRAATNFAV